MPVDLPLPTHIFVLPLLVRPLWSMTYCKQAHSQCLLPCRTALKLFPSKRSTCARHVSHHQTKQRRVQVLTLSSADKARKLAGRLYNIRKILASGTGMTSLSRTQRKSIAIGHISDVKFCPIVHVLLNTVLQLFLGVRT